MQFYFGNSFEKRSTIWKYKWVSKWNFELHRSFRKFDGLKRYLLFIVSKEVSYSWSLALNVNLYLSKLYLSNFSCKYSKLPNKRGVQITVWVGKKFWNLIHCSVGHDNFEKSKKRVGNFLKENINCFKSYTNKKDKYKKWCHIEVMLLWKIAKKSMKI